MKEVEEVNQTEEMKEVEEVNQTEEMNEDELEVDNDRKKTIKNKINIESIENNSVSSQSTKEINNNKFIKLVRRKNKSLIFI